MLFKVLFKEDVHAKKIMLDEELLQYIRFLRNVSFYTFFNFFFLGLRALRLKLLVCFIIIF